MTSGLQPKHFLYHGLTSGLQPMLFFRVAELPNSPDGTHICCPELSSPHQPTHGVTKGVVASVQPFQVGLGVC